MSKAAELIVKCLENEGVEVVFGLPGEENIRFVQALASSNIRYVLTRHEQAASFMAEMYGRVTGRAAVVSATLGPGAINMQLGVADATTNSTPDGRDLRPGRSGPPVQRVAPVRRPGVDVRADHPVGRRHPDRAGHTGDGPQSVQARRDRTPGSGVPGRARAHRCRRGRLRPDARCRATSFAPMRRPSARWRARSTSLRKAKRPVVLAGHGAARSDATEALVRFSEKFGIPVANTFHGKGVMPDDHPNSIGTLGFMRHDYVNFGFDNADVVIAVGYELQEFDPVRINPKADKKIIHIHRFPAEVDAHYSVDVGIIGDISESLDALAEALDDHVFDADPEIPGSGLLDEEFARGQQDSRYPLAPAAVGRRHPRGAGPQRRRAGRHRRHQDVDGAALPDLRAQHLPGLKWPVHHELCATRSPWSQVGAAGVEGAGRGRVTARS